MLFCERCGQSKYISDDSFIEYVSISGTETRYLSPDDGDVVDYGDSNTEADGGNDEVVCPHCEGGSIDMDWEGTEEDAFNQRAEYEKEMSERNKERKKELYQVQTKESEWDLSHNI